MLSLTTLVGEAGVAALKDGDNGESGEAPGRREGVLTLIVTCLDVNAEGGSASRSRGFCSGVVGIVEMVGSESTFMAELLLRAAAGTSPAAGEGGDDIIVSTDRLRETLLREVRRRFRDEISLSSKGLGRVEQGSEETARSRESSGCRAPAIWLVQSKYLVKLLLGLHYGGSCARGDPAAAVQGLTC